MSRPRLPKLLAPALAVAIAGPALAAPSDGRQAELLHRLKQDCGSCHGLTMRGGLGPPLSPQAIGGKPDDALVDAILNGRPRTPMPPWRFEITPDEAAWLVHQLRQGIGR